jgi:hypothetical protein
VFADLTGQPKNFIREAKPKSPSVRSNRKGIRSYFETETEMTEVVLSSLSDEEISRLLGSLPFQKKIRVDTKFKVV